MTERGNKQQGNDLRDDYIPEPEARATDILPAV